MSPQPLVVLLLAGALVLWPARAAGAARWAALQATVPVVPARASAAGHGRAQLRRWLLPAGAGVLPALLVGGVVGLGAGAGTAVLAERLLRGRAPSDGTADRAAVARDLPVACDLLGVCLAAGMPVEGALEAVGGAVGDPVGAHLRSVAALSRLGAGPRRAWAEVPPELAPLARVLVRAGESGAAVAGGLRTLAAESRAAERAATAAAVQRAGIWVLAPLGACFLPAFLCLGVVPLVLGIAGDVFG